MAASLSRYAAALRYRDFRRLITAFGIDATGSWVASVVLDVYVFTATGSLAWLAAMAAASWIPGLLLAPLGGVIADRYDRRTVMIVSATLGGLVGVAIVTVVAVEGPIILLLLLGIIASAVRTPYGPAAGALTPDIVDERTLPTANSMIAALDNVVVVVGPALGGLLLLLNEPVIGLSLNAASYFAAAAIAWSLRIRSRGDAAPGENALRQIRHGMAALRATPTAAVLVLFAAVDTTLAGAYTVVYIPISQHVGMGPNGYGYLLAGAAIGGIVGAAVADRLSTAQRLAPIMVGGVLIQSLPYAITPFTDVAAVAIALQVVSGFGMVIVDVMALTAIQREVQSGLLSRVLSLFDSVELLASVVGAVVAAVLLTALPFGTALIVLAAGCAGIALALSPFLIGSDRRAARRADALRERVEILGDIPLFSDTSHPVKERLASAMARRALQPGELLIREGEAADALWVLADGTLDVSSSTLPVGQVIPDVVAPDVVGELGILREIPRTATVTAKTGATVWRIDADEFRVAMEPQRLPLLLIGPAMTRLNRTHPHLAATAPAALTEPGERS